MRKKITGILILLIFTSICQAQVIDRIIAKVDNYIVLQSELDIAYQQFSEAMQGQFTPEQTKCKVLETLIVNKLLLAKAEIDSVTVDRKMVDDQLDRRMQYFIQQVGSEEKLESYYGKSVEELKNDLRKQVKEQMITQKMQETITAKIKITPGEVSKFFSLIPKDSLPYFSTEVEIGQIVKKAMVSVDQKSAARRKLLDIRTRIINGEDFCNLARMYSEDPVSAKECGELGFFNKGDLVPAYENAALRLKPNETSEIVESEFGYHIIQLLGRRGNEYNTRHILIKAVSSQKDLNVTRKFLDSLRNNVIAGRNSFEYLATENSDDKFTGANGGMFKDQTTNDTRITLESIDPGMFFMIDTMKVGSISIPMPFRFEDGSEGLRILYFKAKYMPHQANLKDDYQKIYQAAMEEKKNNAINIWFDKTKTEVFIDILPEFKDCKILQNQ